MCEQCEKLQAQVTLLLDNNIRLNRDIQDLQRAKTPKLLANAKLYAANNTVLNFAYHMQSQTLLHVTSILVLVTSPGVLQIAERTIPVNGLTVLSFGWLGMVIRPEDLITLTQTSAGNMGLEFLGEELSDRGKRW